MKGTRRSRTAAVAIGLLSASILVACGKSETEAPTTAAASAADAAPTTPAPPKGPLEMPVAPEWAAAYLGKPIPTAWTIGPMETCTGNFDGVRAKGATPEAAVRVYGWSWNSRDGRTIDRLLLADGAGTIVGFAEGGSERKDVAAGRSDVKSANTGFEGATQAISGPVRALGLTDDTGGACWIGTLGSVE